MQTKTKLPKFQVIFNNSGSAVFQTRGFVHDYEDMSQLAEDLRTFERNGNTDGWDGHQPEFRIKIDEEFWHDVRSGGYQIYYALDEIINGAEARGYSSVEECAEALKGYMDVAF